DQASAHFRSLRPRSVPRPLVATVLRPLLCRLMRAWARPADRRSSIPLLSRTPPSSTSTTNRHIDVNAAAAHTPYFYPAKSPGINFTAP
ncbi:unnamed protein product, partial [Ectocarpus sp. 12 AP-2014]